ncbi:MAG: hypothetical protein Ct9H90mP10_00080 [Actinomycetota bacterium]|nr:MAG: hypothetical protein Ct9H90mP10_00080 [Actinomycetota bacterium]
MNEVAPNYPDINFAITDGVAEPGNEREECYLSMLKDLSLQGLPQH